MSDGQVVIDITADDAAFKRSLSGLGKVAAVGVAGLALVLAGVGGAALKFSTDFNKGMANVASLIPGNIERVKELKDTVQDMAVEFGKDTAGLTDGLYQTISAFGDTSETAKILETNVKAAAAGVASTQDAINLTSAVTKAYGDTSVEAVGKVSDLALMTVRLGQTTFPELAASIGAVTPLTKELGASQEELFAVMATLTGVTGGAAEVSTQLRGAMQALMAPTADAQKAIEDAGYADAKAMLAKEGLAGSLKILTDAADKSGKPLQNFVSSIEGQVLALALAGPQAEEYAKKLAEMESASGTTDEAFAEQATGINALGFAFDRLKQVGVTSLQKLGDMVGNAFGKDLVGSVDDIKSAVDDILAGIDPMNGDPEKVRSGVQKLVLMLADGVKAAAPTAITAIAALVTSVASAIPGILPGLASALITGVLSIAEALPAVLPAFITAFQSLVVMLAGALPQLIPDLMTGMLSLLMALVAAIPVIIPALIKGLVAAFLALGLALPGIVSQLITGLSEGLVTLAEALPTLLPVIINGLVQLFTASFEALPMILPTLIVAIADIIAALAEAIPPMLPLIVSALLKLAPMLVGVSFQLVVGLVKGLVQAFPSLIKAGVALVTGLIDAVKSMLGIHSPSRVFMEIGKMAVLGLSNAITAGKAMLLSAATRLLRLLIENVQNRVRDFTNIGRDIANGIRNGLTNTWSGLVAKLRTLTNLLPDTVKRLLKIASPSRVFEWIGEMMMDGWINSVATGGAAVVDSVRRTAQGVIDAASDPIIASAMSLSPSAISGATYRPAVGAVGSASGAVAAAAGRHIEITQVYQTPVTSYADTQRGVLDASRAAAAY